MGVVSTNEAMTLNVFDKNMSAGLFLNCSVMLLYLNLFRECQYKMFEKKYQLYLFYLIKNTHKLQLYSAPKINVSCVQLNV